MRSQASLKSAVGLVWLGILLATQGVQARAQNSSFQAWPEIDTFVKLNSRTRVSFFASQTRENSKGTDAEIGPNIDLYLKPLRKTKRFILRPFDESKTRLLMFRGGYRYMPSTSNPVEQRIIVETTARHSVFWEVLVSDRNRADLRFIEGDFSWRYRNRITAERNFAIKKLHFAPYIRVEGYFDSRYGKFSRTAETVGSTFDVGKHLDIEPYYEHQNDTSKPPNRQVNALGLVIRLYF
jgi:hypothetical protein